MTPSVTIVDDGREAHVTYREGSHAMTGYQEFGGTNVVAIVSMGSMEDWRTHHAWAVDRRAQILRFVADEVIRQKAPGCSVEIDEASGNIVLRNVRTSAAGLLRAASSNGAAASTRADASWVFRFSLLKARLALLVLVIAVIVGAGLWIKTRIGVP